jgi:septum formation protein
MKNFIYLASQSPRRSQLLDQIGVPHTLLLPAPNEDAESLELALRGESPLHYVNRVTARKLDAAVLRLKLRQLPLAPVLCSDTTVALGRNILGKPADAKDAERMLQALSGQTHRVLTAVAIQSGRKRLTTVSVSRVTFAALSRAQIKAYARSGEPMGKAGAYGVQGLAAAHISAIEGSYSGIMGLPVHETAVLLRQVGVRC